MIYPWQIEQWQKLQQARLANRLPHALLFKGVAGIGKSHFAYEFAQSILCLSDDQTNSPCGKCHGCRQVIGHAHPDLFEIMPEKEGQAIKIDQIRLVTEFASQSSLQNGFRVVIINPAHAMNVNAANALLKTLEEPAHHVIIILVSHQIHRMPVTILSRCQRVNFTCPDREVATEWLKAQLSEKDYKDKMSLEALLSLVDGAPLSVSELINSDTLTVRQILFEGLSADKINPIKLSETLSKHDTLTVIDFYISWLADLLRIISGVNDADISNHDYARSISRVAANMAAHKLITLIDQASRMRKIVCDGINLNKQLLLEDLLIRWAQHVNIPG